MAFDFTSAYKKSLTLGELASYQRRAGSHLTFSLTLACPLRCEHCAVDAGPEHAASTVDVELACRYVQQMPALKALGIKSISFTGGEPLLAKEPLHLLSTAAGEFGMTCGLVTAAHWAQSNDDAQRIIASFPAIHSWDFSIDRFHHKFVPIHIVRRGFEAARSQGKSVMLRFACDIPPTAADLQIWDEVRSFATEKDISIQKLRKIGRGQNIKTVITPDELKATPCLTQGLIVRHDGSIGPCCVSLAEERNHPFQFGNSRFRSLTEIYEDYMCHPLLQLIRVIGFSEPVRWLLEAGMEEFISEPMPEDACDLCFHIFTNQEIGAYLEQRAALPANRLRIAVLVSKALKEHLMLRNTVATYLRNGGLESDGWETAAAMVAEIDKNIDDTASKMDCSA